MRHASKQSVGSCIRKEDPVCEHRIWTVHPSCRLRAPVPSDRSVPPVPEREIRGLLIEDWSQRDHVCHERHLVPHCWHHVMPQPCPLLRVGHLPPLFWPPAIVAQCLRKISKHRLGMQPPSRQFRLRRQLPASVPGFHTHPGTLQDHRIPEHLCRLPCTVLRVHGFIQSLPLRMNFQRTSTRLPGRAAPSAAVVVLLSPLSLGPVLAARKGKILNECEGAELFRSLGSTRPTPGLGRTSVTTR